MGVPHHLYGGIGTYLSLSHKKRSCASHASHEGWTDGGKGNNPEDHHALRLSGIHRAACCAGTGPSFRWVGGAARCRDSRRHLVAIGFYFIFLVYKENTFS